jgi:inhibitor of cysteine peptidase
MKAKKYWILAGLVVGIFASAHSATEDSEERSSLAGLQGIYVLVEPLPVWTEQYGLTVQETQTQVELRLRQDGIKVLSKIESAHTVGRVFLYVNINTQKSPVYMGREECPVSCSLALRQDVYLARDRAKFVGGAATWDMSSVGLCSANQLPKFIKTSIDNLLDQFINDYLAANPKERSTDEKAPWRIEAKVGQDFVIALPSNPSTGYKWRLARPLPSMLKLQRKRYIPDKPRKIGSGGTEKWAFKSVRSGKVTIMFECVQPWDKKSPPAMRRSFSIVAK